MRCIVFALSLIVFAAAAMGEDQAVSELLERMRAMEEQMKAQQKEIGTLRQQLKTAQHYQAVRPSIEMQIDRSLATKGPAPHFIHNPEKHQRDITIGGYLDVTYQATLQQPDTRDNVERVFDRFDDNDFNVHLAEIFFDGTAQEPGQAGFRVDLSFGTDANLFEATHNGAQGMAVSNTTDNFSLQQAYIDYIIPVGKGLRMKAGKFVTRHGMEVIEAGDNWNATRSFNFGKAIPFTHTGVGFEYQVFESWQVKLDIINGWDNLQDNNTGKSLMVQSVWTPVKWVTWSWTGMAGLEKTDARINGEAATANLGYADKADEDMRYLINSTLILTPWDNWAFGLEFSWGLEENATNNAAEDNTAGNGSFGGTDGNTPLNFTKKNLDYGDAMWWGAAAYLKYSFWEKWYVAARGEYFNDRDGTRSVYAAAGDGFDAAARQRIELYSGTVTLSYKPVDPFEVRFEYRHDAASRDAFYGHDVDNLVTPANGGPVHFGQPGGFRDRTQHQDSVTLQFLYSF